MEKAIPTPRPQCWCILCLSPFISDGLECPAQDAQHQGPNVVIDSEGEGSNHAAGRNPSDLPPPPRDGP